MDNDIARNDVTARQLPKPTRPPPKYKLHSPTSPSTTRMFQRPPPLYDAPLGDPRVHKRSRPYSTAHATTRPSEPRTRSPTPPPEADAPRWPDRRPDPLTRAMPDRHHDPVIETPAQPQPEPIKVNPPGRRRSPTAPHQPQEHCIERVLMAARCQNSRQSPRVELTGFIPPVFRARLAEDITPMDSREPRFPISLFCGNHCPVPESYVTTY